MTNYYRFQIVEPNNQIRYSNEFAAECVSITVGAASANDLALVDPTIADYQLVLYLQAPLQVMNLSALGQVLLASVALPVNEYRFWAPGQRIEVGQHALILLDRNGSVTSVSDAVATPTTTSVTSPGTVPSSAISAVVSTRESVFSTPNFAVENRSEVERVQQTEVNSRIEWKIELHNTSEQGPQGGRVAGFRLMLEGVSPDWQADVAPAELQLNHVPPTPQYLKPMRGEFRVAITAPQTPTSRAGLHEIIVRITSEEFPGEVLVIPLRIKINPYMAWQVSKLTPSYVYGRSRSPVETHFTLVNQSNAPLLIETIAGVENLVAAIAFIDKQASNGFATIADESHALELPVAGQARVYVRITPQRRYWLGREQSYPLFVASKAVLLDHKPIPQEQEAKEVRGAYIQQPRFGYLHIFFCLLLLCLLFVGALFLFRPSIPQFALTDWPLPTLDANKTVPIPTPVVSAPKYVVAGAQLALDWGEMNYVSHFTINRLLDNGREEPVLTADAHGAATTPYTLTARNGESATYIILGTNWIAQLPLISQWGVTEQRVRLEVAPVIASLSTKVDTTGLAAQSPLTLTWQVSERNMQVTLLENNQPKPLTGTNSLTGTFGELLRAPLTNTVYQIQAQSVYPHEPVISPPLAVKVIPATPTVVPVPEIHRFEVMPPQLVAGQKVTVLYDVPDAQALYLLLDDVQIAELKPPAGQEQFVLDQPKRYRVTIRAMGQPTMTVGAVSTRWHTIEVLPPPTAPQIRLFKVSPDSVTRGSDAAKNITLLWTVVGEVQNIRIVSADKLIASNLPMSGTLKLTAENSTNYQILVEGKDSPIQSAVATLTVAGSSLIGGSPAGSSTTGGAPAGGSLAEQLQQQQFAPPTVQITPTTVDLGTKTASCLNPKEEITQTTSICLFTIDLPVPAVSVTLVGVKQDGDQCTRTLWKQWGYADIPANKLTYQCGECMDDSHEYLFTVYAEDSAGTVRQAQQTLPAGRFPLACK